MSPQAIEARSDGDLRTKIWLTSKELKLPSAFVYSDGRSSLPFPYIEVPPYGFLGIPLSTDDAKKIISKASQSLLSEGDETIVDTSVRKSWELNPNQFFLKHPDWNKALENVVDTVITGLGFNEGSANVSAKLYKLLLYDEGAFYKAHKDSEKIPGMLARLIVCLPSLHEGGKLVLTHDDKSHEFETAASFFSLSYAAWYLDVVHEVLPVTSGYRIVLTYNLIRQADFEIPLHDSLYFHKQEEQLSILLKDYSLRLEQGDEELPPILVHKLKNKYTQDNLKLESLDPQDLAQVSAFRRISTKLGFDIYLSILELKVNTYKDCIWFSEKRTQSLKHIVELDGKLVVKSFECPKGAVIDPTPHDAETSDKRDCQWYKRCQHITNWYRNTVVVLVPPMKQIDFVFQFGTTGEVVKPLFCKLIREFSENPAQKASEFSKDAAQTLLKFSEDPVPKPFEFSENSVQKPLEFSENLAQKVLEFPKDAAQKALEFSEDPAQTLLKFSEDPVPKPFEFFEDPIQKPLEFSEVPVQKPLEFSENPGQKPLEKLCELALKQDISDFYSIPFFFKKAARIALDRERFDLFDEACKTTNDEIILNNGCSLGRWAAIYGLNTMNDRLMKGVKVASTVAEKVEFLKSVDDGFAVQKSDSPDRAVLKQCLGNAILINVLELTNFSKDDAKALAQLSTTMERSLFESKMRLIMHFKVSTIFKIIFINELISILPRDPVKEQQPFVKAIISNTWSTTQPKSLSQFEDPDCRLRSGDLNLEDLSRIIENTVKILSPESVEMAIIPAMLRAIPGASKKCANKLFISFVRMILKNELVGFELSTNAAPLPSHKCLVQALLTKYLIEFVGLKPPRNLSLPAQQCKTNCKDCSAVNKFLEDPDEKNARFRFNPCGKTRRVHLNENFPNRDTSSYEAEPFEIGKHWAWRITKNWRFYETAVSKWNKKTETAKQTLLELKKNEPVAGRLEAYLHPYFNIIMNANVKELPAFKSLVVIPQIPPAEIVWPAEIAGPACSPGESAKSNLPCSHPNLKREAGAVDFPAKRACLYLQTSPKLGDSLESTFQS